MKFQTRRGKSGTFIAVLTLAIPMSQATAQVAIEQTGEHQEATLDSTNALGATVNIKQLGGKDNVAGVTLEQLDTPVIIGALQTDTSNSKEDLTIKNTTVGGFYQVRQEGGEGHVATVTVDGAANSALDALQQGSKDTLDVTYKDVSNYNTKTEQRGGDENKITLVATDATGNNNLTQDGSNNEFTGHITGNSGDLASTQQGTRNIATVTINNAR